MNQELEMMEIMEATDVLIAAQSEFTKWVMPPQHDSLKFAVCEAGEVIDAEMRMNPLYFRNNQKSLDKNAEIVDVLMMLTKFIINNQQHDLSYKVNADRFYKELRWWDLEKIKYTEALFFQCLSEICLLIAYHSDNYAENMVHESIVYIFSSLYSMLPVGFYLNTIQEKMNTYREKLKKVG